MRWKWIIFAALSAALIVGARNYFRSSAAHVDSNLIKQASPEEILGRLRDMHSPLVLINFWASWCEPCKLEFPGLLSLREKLAAQGVQVVFVSVDDARDVGDAEGFLRSHHVSFQTYYKGAQSMQFVTDIYPKWMGALPTTILLDTNMQVLEAWEGDTAIAEFEQGIRRHMRGS